MEESMPPIDPDFEPQSRPRSCTWPLPRPDISAVKVEAAEGAESAAETPPEPQPVSSEPEKAAAAAGAAAAGEEGGAAAGVGGAAATPRKGSSRRNAWGNQSYADLISQAIENSPEKRLTLAQIYDWMVKTVPYFRDKGDSNSSAGWKNSIRHNLSLHNKFLRVHNESTGKSSWWMLNPEGGKTGKAPRRRAVSMDNSSKLLKSRMRAKQTKKQAGAGGAGGVLQVDGGGGGGGGSGGGDSPGSSQQFPKWGVNSSSPSSRGSLDDADMWTTFRPRTSSNASTLSGRLSPIAPGQEDDDSLPDDGLLGRYSSSSRTPTLTETVMEELDLIDNLTLMTGQPAAASPSTAPAAPPTPLPSASTLLPRGSSFSPFHQLQTTTPAQNPVSLCGPGGKEPATFSNSLFNPMSVSSTHCGAHYVPSSLEALLTSDSPPPSDVLMAQVGPLMGGSACLSQMGLGLRPKPTQMQLGKGLEASGVAPMQLQPQQHHLHQHHPQISLGMILSGISQDASPLSGLKAHQATVPAMGPHHNSPVLLAGQSVGQLGMGPFGTAAGFPAAQERLPTDLDIDMFTENLDCDVDYIINSDLMDGDGIDFNFDPILPAGQGYPGPTSAQGSAHSWVPS